MEILSLAERRRARRQKGASESPTSVLSPAESRAGSEGVAEEGIEREAAALATATPAAAASMVETAAKEALAAKEAARAAKRAEIEAKVAAAKLLQPVKAAEAAVAASTKAMRTVKAADLFAEEGRETAPKASTHDKKNAQHDGFIVKSTRMQADYGDRAFIKP